MEVRMKEVDGGGVEKQWNALEPNGIAPYVCFPSGRRPRRITPRIGTRLVIESPVRSGYLHLGRSNRLAAVAKPKLTGPDCH